MNRPLPVAAGALHVGPGELAGISVKEISAAAGEIRVYDNASAASGTLVFVATCAASGSINLFDIDARLEAGAFIQIVAGAFVGSVHVA